VYSDQQGAETHKLTATFRTFTIDLERLRKWLEDQHVSHVALESTGVFRIPVWNILERSEAKFQTRSMCTHCLVGRRIRRIVTVLLNYCNAGC
jgi:hypothetical protein